MESAKRKHLRGEWSFLHPQIVNRNNHFNMKLMIDPEIGSAGNQIYEKSNECWIIYWKKTLKTFFPPDRNVARKFFFVFHPTERFFRPPYKREIVFPPRNMQTKWKTNFKISDTNYSRSFALFPVGAIFLNSRESNSTVEAFLLLWGGIRAKIFGAGE